MGDSGAWLLRECQVCPRCFVLARREDGCSHLVCRCSCDFCFGCGAPFELQEGEATGCQCHDNDYDYYDYDYDDDHWFGDFEGDRWTWEIRQVQMRERWQRRALEREFNREQSFGRWLRIAKQHPAIVGKEATEQEFSRKLAELREA